MQNLYSCYNPHVSASADVFPGMTFDVLLPHLLTHLLIGFLLLLLKDKHVLGTEMCRKFCKQFKYIF